MNTETQKSYLHFSSLFYKRDSMMAQVSKKQNIQTQMDHFSSKDPKGKEMCQRFMKQDFIGQQKMVAEEGMTLMKAFCEVVAFQFQNDGLMKYFLATIDGILTANKQNIHLLKMVLKA